MQKTKGLKFERHFTSDQLNVYNQFDYDLRQSVIKNPNGEYVIEMMHLSYIMMRLQPNLDLK